MQHEDTKATKDFEESLSFAVIGAAVEVHRAVGPGLLESVYEQCLCHELVLRGIRVRRQVPLPLVYKGVRISCGYRIDVLVEDRLVIELKAVDRVPPVALAQLLSHLRLLNRRLGLLINFHEEILRKGVRRVVNGW